MYPKNIAFFAVFGDSVNGSVPMAFAASNNVAYSALP